MTDRPFILSLSEYEIAALRSAAHRERIRLRKEAAKPFTPAPGRGNVNEYRVANLEAALERISQAMGAQP